MTETTRKFCGHCMATTEQTLFHTHVEVIPNYRPWSGRRRLAPRPATKTTYTYECMECHHLNDYYGGLTYTEYRRKRD